jgi:ABC-type nickel/cobalt efflux system permease component RcnA
MTPCPVALAAIVLGLSISNFSELGSLFLYLFVFSTGLGLVITLVGLLTLYASERVSKIMDSKLSKWPLYLSRTSALLVLIIGVSLTFHALFFSESLTQGHEQEFFKWLNLLGLESTNH